MVSLSTFTGSIIKCEDVQLLCTLYLPPLLTSARALCMKFFPPSPLPNNIHSYGIVLWEIYTRKTPYRDCTLNILSLQQSIVGGMRPPISPTWPAFYAELAQQCWEADPQARPSFATVLQVLKSETVKPITDEMAAGGDDAMSRKGFGGGVVMNDWEKGEMEDFHVGSV